MEFAICEGKAHKFQGAIGEARCIYELTKRGYVIYKPLAELSKSDLVVESPEGILLKVQVKTSGCDNGYGTGFQVMLATSGGNTKNNTRKARMPGDYDLLFVLTNDGRCWLIPNIALENVSSQIVVGTKKYEQYELK